MDISATKSASSAVDAESSLYPPEWLKDILIGQYQDHEDFHHLSQDFMALFSMLSSSIQDAETKQAFHAFLTDLKKHYG